MGRNAKKQHWKKEKLLYGYMKKMQRIIGVRAFGLLRKMVESIVSFLLRIMSLSFQRYRNTPLWIVMITFMGTFRPESLRIWITHPRNRRNIQSDLLIFTLLSVVTMGLVTVCLLGMQYFVIEGKKIGISKLWTKRAIWSFLVIVVMGYITTVYFLGKDQVSPWYRWWKSTVNVRLVMDPQLFRRPHDTFHGFDNQTADNAVLHNVRYTAHNVRRCKKIEVLVDSV
nr:PREDICTED: uncharacterized protein LOC105662077 [Megachile rotundata]